MNRIVNYIKARLGFRPKVKELNVADLFTGYLQTANIDPRKIQAHRLADLRTAYYFAIGQILIFQRDNLKNVPEKARAAKMEELIQECESYLNK